MNKKPINNVALFRKFIETMDANDIWYSLHTKCIAGSLINNALLDWSKRIDVFIDLNSYNKMKKLFPNNVIDSSIDPDYDSLTAAWIFDNKQWQDDQPFIRIYVMVPTTIKKIKKYRSSTRRLAMKVKGEKNTLDHAIDELLQTKGFEGYYIIKTRKEDNGDNWIPNLSFKRVEAPLLGLVPKVFKEYDTILKQWYGQDYVKVISKQPKIIKEYKGPREVNSI